MPKTERILGYLPLTFLAGGDPSALRAVVGAFGGELQKAENSLAAVMRAHWVDFADSGADQISDLACIGSLYGLHPRADKTVEEFREHLKRYVKTFLDGTVTVQGLMRIAAETLQLHIEDDYDRIDAWWERPDEPVITTEPSGADAAALVFGVASVRRDGADAGPAVITGPVLAEAVDLRDQPLLWLALDGGGTVAIDLTDEADDPAGVDIDAMARAINAVVGFGLAEATEGRLQLATTSVGPAAGIEVADGPQDAAPLVLGLPPRTYEGADARPATLTGSADLSNPTDLRQHRYLRIDIDGNHLAEIDVAGLAADPAAVTVDQVAQAIDAGIGLTVASHDGRFLTVTSPTPGGSGHIALLTAAAQDAGRAVFGSGAGFTFGTDPRPARVTGTTDIGIGIDLTERSTVRMTVDGLPAVSVDVAGADPAATTPGEIVTSLNAGLGDTVAEHDGRFVTLRSPTIGAAGVLGLEDVDGDATEAILGTPARTFHGTPAVTAALTGTTDLTTGVDLTARPAVVVVIDDGPPIEVDLRSHAGDLRTVTLDQLAESIDAATGSQVATDDGAHLILVSPTTAAGGRIEVRPLTTTTSRRFLSRSLVTDDAGTRIFGFTARTARGTEATSARLVGANDLLAGIDLRPARFLRLAIDRSEPVEIDCAGPRPRATTAAEIVTAINQAVGVAVASTDGHVVTLVSPTAGVDSAITLEPTRSHDAVSPLGLEAGLVRGIDATGVAFAGLVDLSAGVDLVADATLAIGVDGGPPVDLRVGDDQPVTRSLSQLVGTVNAALAAQIAAHDGTRLYLTSPTRGSGAGIRIAAPSTGVDVTTQLLGVDHRTYVGAAATSAAASGSVDLAAAEPLGLRTFLRLAVDGSQPIDIDLAAGAADPTHPNPSEIATAINAASPAIASIVGGRLRILSPTAGSASRLEIGHADVGDARRGIFGEIEFDVEGRGAGPAVLTGEADLLAPVDLAHGSIIRLAVDGLPPVDIDVIGGSPGATLLDEIVAAIDDALPGVAAPTADDRLQLTSQTGGPDSSVEVVALRRIEVQEYPPEGRQLSVEVGHGSRFTIDNQGAAGTLISAIEIDSPSGIVGPHLAAVDRGWSVKIDVAVSAGGRLEIQLDHGQVVAEIRDRFGTTPVEGASIKVTGDTDEVFRLHRGGNRFVLLECDDSRFDYARFDHDSFAGGPCIELGVFNASRFSDPPEVRTVFADPDHVSPLSVLTARWEEHRAGALVVNLPDRLDERYGVHFGEGRFGSAEPELFAGVVTEPVDDPRYVLNAIGNNSGLIEAHLAPRVPIGWSAAAMPFRDPQPLTQGTATQEARIYLSEEGLGGDFLELRARHLGPWANRITVSARQSGPAVYDLEIHYPGGRFENARAVVAGLPLVGGGDPPIGCALAPKPGAQSSPVVTPTGGGRPTLASEILAPGPIGVLTAAAAGVQVTVTRDRVGTTDP